MTERLLHALRHLDLESKILNLGDALQGCNGVGTSWVVKDSQFHKS